jgi:hypothetical protein
MISRTARQLRDAILEEAHGRGVLLDEESFKNERGLPVLRLRLGDRVLRGTQVRLPGSSRHLPDVITVHGSGHRASRMWPRRHDGTFNIAAVVDRLLALVRTEIERPTPDLAFMTHGVPTGASGLHVMHVGAVLLGAMAAGSSHEDLVAKVADQARRARIAAHVESGGLLDSDLRALGDAAGLFFGRPTKLDDWDPLQPISDRILTMLKLGRLHGGMVERRFVLVLERQGDRITLADPSGSGVAEVQLGTLQVEWRLGANGGRPWVGAISRWERASR